jgi:hypothetical protein
LQKLARNLQHLLQQCGFINLKNCLCQRWKVKFGYHDNYSKINCEMMLWKVFKAHVLDMPSLRLINMQLLKKECKGLRCVSVKI